MKKLVAYLTTGFPDIQFTHDAILTLKEAGVDVLELGIPFSDPVADGEIIQQTSLQALQNGFKLNDLFTLSQTIGSQIDTYWMGYFNSFYKKGVSHCCAHAIKSHIKGFIIPDLPYEEALKYKELFDVNRLINVTFVAPTDTKSRIEKLVAHSQGFIYLVAYAGITGAGRSEDLSHIIHTVRETTTTPLYLGFGVNASNAKDKSQSVDGVIVGSEFMKVLLQKDLTHSQKLDTIATIARTIKESINT